VSAEDEASDAAEKDAARDAAEEARETLEACFAVGVEACGVRVWERGERGVSEEASEEV
jgi:hypothetical protein